MNPKVGVIIVNYKDYANRFLGECRDSLRAQTYPADCYRVYIVDNATGEKTRQYLADAYPEAVILPRPDGNYSAANNAGIAAARRDGCTLFAIANMDTRFDPTWLAELVAAVISDSKIGIAQSKIVLYPQNQAEWNDPKINSVGNVQHYLGFGYTRGYGQKAVNYANMKNILEIDGYASGCSLIVKQAVLDQIGGYDEEYYMYHDDIELNWRAKLAGWKIVLASQSVVYHKYEFNRSMRMFYYMERNRWVALLSFYRIRTLLLLAPILLVMELGMLGFSFLHKSIMTKFRVGCYFLTVKAWRHIAKARRQVRSIRRVGDGELMARMNGRLDFQEVDNWLLRNAGNPICELYFYVIRKIIRW